MRIHKRQEDGLTGRREHANQDAQWEVGVTRKRPESVSKVDWFTLLMDAEGLLQAKIWKWDFRDLHNFVRSNEIYMQL